MTVRQLRPILELLSDTMLGMNICRDMLLFPEHDLVLRGIAFDHSSTDPKKLFPTPFFMPLYVPHAVCHFTHGTRLPGQWTIDDSNLVRNLSDVLRPHSERLKVLADPIRVSAELALQRKTSDRNMYVRETYAYSLIVSNQLDGAERELCDLVTDFAPTRDWEQSILDRAKLITLALHEDAAIARAQLLAWRKVTAANLKIDEI